MSSPFKKEEWLTLNVLKNILPFYILQLNIL